MKEDKRYTFSAKPLTKFLENLSSGTNIFMACLDKK